MTATVIVVGADKGGVGKTTVARTLLDYFTALKVNVRAFDAQAPAGDLNRFATFAKVVDLTKVQGQMEVFDGVADDVITVIDLPAGMLSPTIKTLHEARLLDDVRDGTMRLVLLHVLGPAIASISEIGSVAKSLGSGVTHLLVKNYINDTGYFDWDTGYTKTIFDKYDGVTIKIPNLETEACERLQKDGGMFSDFARDNPSRMLRGKVKTWLGKTWHEFERVKVLA